MRQTRLERFFDAPQPLVQPGFTFFVLPLPVRIHVYGYLPLERAGCIHLNCEEPENSFIYKSPRKKDCFRSSCGNPRRFDVCICVPPILPFLLVSRQFYREICEVLYARNQFKISRHAPGGIHGLFSLGSVALTSLTSLTIAIHDCQSPCEKGWRYQCGYDSDNESDKWESYRPRKQIGQNSRHDKAIIREWERLCKHIAASIQPSRLQLCLICDTRDCETAKMIVQPLQHLPRLLACSIRLSTKCNPKLRDLAERTALQLTGRTTEQSSWLTYPYLPHELQERILEHTDLVGPHDIEWLPGSGFMCRCISPYECGWAPQPEWNALNPCQVCIAVNVFCYREIIGPGASNSQCQCWRFPKALFLLNRELRRDAIRIFYSRNRFVILPCGGGDHFPSIPVEFPPFVRQVPHTAIRFLRSIYFIIPGPGQCSPR